MGQLDPVLLAWFDQGLRTGQFNVPNGRHIVLNQFPRLMKEARLRASAGVASGELRNFLIAINPSIAVVTDGSPTGMRRQLASEHDELPAIRKVLTPMLPNQKLEQWFVYTPPLAVMRRSWLQFASHIKLH